MIQFKKRNINRTGASRTKKEDDNEEEEEEDDSSKIISKNTSSKILNSKQKSSVDEIRLEKVTTVYQSSREVVPQQFAGDSATAVTQIDTSMDRDAIAILEKQKVKPSLISIKPSNQFGPQRAPTFLRATSRFDYQPDICKDYKETGFCGYGDNCKFLHDRGDYKSGWQMEREWEEKQNAKKRKLQNLEDKALISMCVDVRSDRRTDNNSTTTNNNDNDEEEENYEIQEEGEFPFACHICRESFVDPVVTLCGHYFCQVCAVNRSKVSTRCLICDKQTYGVFNKARNLIKYMQSKGLLIKNKKPDNDVDESDLYDNEFEDQTNPNNKVEIKTNSSMIIRKPLSKGKWEDI